MQQYGLGVSIGDVVHARDIFLDKSYRQENGRKGFYTSFYEITDYVQDLFQELNGEQFKQSVSDLHQAFQELEPNMDNSTQQNLSLSRFFHPQIHNIRSPRQRIIDHIRNITLAPDRKNILRKGVPKKQAQSRCKENAVLDFAVRIEG